MTTDRDKNLELRREIELLIQKFADSSGTAEQVGDRDTALFQIFARCGISWRNNIQFKNDRQSIEIDGDFELPINGSTQKLLVEIKNTFDPEIISQTLR